MILVLLLLSVLSTTCALVTDIKPIRDVVRGFGYDLETHTVLTSDGYKLTVHRLLRGSHGEDEDAAPTDAPTTPALPASDVDCGVPVLLVEGILQSSASNLAKGNGIAYSLADQGFDVWLSNYRGNMYSRQHETISPDQPAFWNFTLHEMGTKDLPAVINFVLDATHYQKLIYMGFSMGSTMFWILASSLPEYQTRVTAMVAVGPVARPSNMVVINKLILRKTLLVIFSAMLAVNHCEMMPYGEKTASIISWACNHKFRLLCENFLSNMNYLRKQEVEINSVFKLIPYSPAGISTKVILHFIQIADARRFQQFDYGTERNQEMYKSPKPPEYDLKKIKLPVYLIYSVKDQVATQKDVDWLAQQLPRRPERRIESVNNFRHADFNYNRDLENLLTRPLTSLITELAEKHRVSLARVTEDFTVNKV